MNKAINPNGLLGYLIQYLTQRYRLPVVIKGLIIMKMIALHLVVFCACCFAEANAQKININVKAASFKEVAMLIHKETGYSISISNRFLKEAKPVTLQMNNVELDDVLEELFRIQPFGYMRNGKTVVVTGKVATVNNKKDINNTFLPLQNIIRGKVTNEEGQPLLGVNVVLKGTKNGTSTDSDGLYSLHIEEQSKGIIVFSYLGYDTQEIILGGRNTINVTLISKESTLEELVVIGYGTQKKVSVTGAIARVNGDELKESPTANVSNMMEGRLSGLLFTQDSGAPGENQSTIRIRGISTFAGSQSPLVLVDGVQEPFFNNIDPNEIESINVLKDASATAVYGVRGANGVILITTKKGRVGSQKISLSSNFALKSFTELRKDLDSYNFAFLYNEALLYDSYALGAYNPRFTDEDLRLYKTGEDPVFHPNTDWYNIIFKPYGFQTHHNLSIRGGTEKTKYFISGGYFKEGGNFNDKISLPNDYLNIKPQLNFNRYNFRSNLEFDILENLKANLNISTRIEERWRTTNSVGHVIQGIYVNPPLSAPSPEVTGGRIVNLPGVVNMDYPDSNPMVLWLTGMGNKGGMNKENRTNLDGLIRLRYDMDFLTKGFSVEGFLSYKSYSNYNYELQKPLVIYDAQRLPDSGVVYVPTHGTEKPTTISTSNGRMRNVYSEFKIDYSRGFLDHEVSGMMLYNQGKDFDPLLAYGIPHAYQGVVGRLTYSYKSRYMAEFNAGYNGTENFAEGKRFGFFPAYSLGWILSEEPVFPQNNILGFLKLRGSYGEVGNDMVGNDRFLYLPSSYYYDGFYHFGEIGSTYNRNDMSHEGLIGNPSLTWEKAKKTNIGVELRLLNDKIEFEGDWFYEKRVDILTRLSSLPSLVGANLPAANIGRMQNTGVDGSVSYSDNLGAFNFKVKFLFTHAQNKVLFRDEVPNIYSYMNQTGLPYGQYFGYLANGFYNTWDEVIDAKRPKSKYNANRLMPGDTRYKDINGDGLIDEKDHIPIGYSSFPRQFYSFSIQGGYKGIHLSVLLQGAAQNSYRPTGSFLRGWDHDNSTPQYWSDLSWTPYRYEMGYPISLPRISASNDLKNNSELSTVVLENANYFRIKNVELGYKLPEHLLSKIKIFSARVFVSGNNLYTWDKLFQGEDPSIPSHSGGNYAPYPITKTYNLGLDLTF